MDIIMLGNGFDLHYGFPTTYLNFLHTTKFLIDNKADYSSVGQIFGSNALRETDQGIRRAYDQYGKCYDMVPLDSAQISDYTQRAADNSWFSYLSEMIGPNSGWIDVETEIAKALKIINVILSKVSRYHDKIVIGSDSLRDRAEAYLVKKFNFFWKEENQAVDFGLNVNQKVILREYQIEEPKGSDIWRINKDLIIDKLFDDLMALATLLKSYLSWFVDEPLSIIVNEHAITKDPALDKIKETPVKVVSFNYTHTWEQLYPTISSATSEITHIHGEAHIPNTLEENNRSIVLGINNDSNDEAKELDTTFIKFKKYYQRIVFSTEMPYRKLLLRISKTASSGIEHRLIVIGHSLDITDKDIIKELFEQATSIIIYYYNEKDFESKVENLVALYGKTDFDALQKKKQVEYVSLSLLNALKTPVLNDRNSKEPRGLIRFMVNKKLFSPKKGD